MGKRGKVLGVGIGVALAVAGVAWPATDFGADVQHQLHSKSNSLFGVTKPLEQSSATSITSQDALANPLHLVTLGKGLTARVVTACNEQGRPTLGWGLRDDRRHHRLEVAARTR
jgi:hypothetical protein